MAGSRSDSRGGLAVDGLHGSRKRHVLDDWWQHEQGRALPGVDSGDSIRGGIAADGLLRGIRKDGPTGANDPGVQLAEAIGELYVRMDD